MSKNMNDLTDLTRKSRVTINTFCASFNDLKSKWYNLKMTEHNFFLLTQFIYQQFNDFCQNDILLISYDTLLFNYHHQNEHKNIVW